MLTKKTSLEETKDVIDTLKWKINTIESANLPTETALADYIAFGLENLDNKIKYIQSIKKDYENEIKETKKQIDFIKVEGAKFLQDAGIDKLDGVICSSITLTSGKEGREEDTQEQVFTPLISQEEIEQLLLDLGKAEMRTVTKTKVTKFIPPKLKINKRRK